MLDFGLAKAVEPAGPSGASQVTTQQRLTTAGTIVGTLQYMAPEQLEGKTIDARTDIFAFGAVLYEMLTGHTAFTASNQAALITAILASDPPSLQSFNVTTAPVVEWLLWKCLAKDPDKRWQSARDLVDVLRWAAAASDAPIHERRPSSWRRAALLIVTPVALGLIALAIIQPRPAAQPSGLGRFSIELPDDVQLNPFFPLPLASPDGKRIAFVGMESAGQRVWVRDVSAGTTAPVAGTDGAGGMFWAPDGEHLAFFTNKALKIAEPDGTIRTLCDGLDMSLETLTGTWNAAGDILISTVRHGPLYHVSVSGSPSCVPATALESSRQELTHLWPHFLPDGRHFLYVARSAAAADTGLYVGVLGSSERKRLMSGDAPATFAAPGYLLVADQSGIFTQGFEPAKLTTAGELRSLIPGSQFVGALSGMTFSASQTGLLAYPSPRERQSQFTWLDETGKLIRRVGKPGTYVTFALSNDGQRLAFARLTDQRILLWQLDVQRGVESQLTFKAQGEGDPRWMNARDLAVTRRPLGVVRLGADGRESVLLSDAVCCTTCPPTAASCSFRKTASCRPYPSTARGPRRYYGVPRAARSIKHSSHLTAKRSHTTLTKPVDGRCTSLLLHPAESVSRCPATVAFSPSGDATAVKLYYLDPKGTLFSVPIDLSGPRKVGTPRQLFTTGIKEPSPWIEEYAVSPDGRAFLVLDPIEAKAPDSIGVIVNWPALLRAPTSR